MRGLPSPASQSASHIPSPGRTGSANQPKASSAFSFAEETRDHVSFWATLIDLLPTPSALCEPDDCVIFNAVFQGMALCETSRFAVEHQLIALSRALRASLSDADPESSASFEVLVACAEGPLRVTARLRECGAKRIVLANIDQVNDLPPRIFLKDQLQLSPREIEALSIMVAGASDKRLAERLRVSFHTARQYAATIIRKIEAPRAQLKTRIWSLFLGLR